MPWYDIFKREIGDLFTSSKTRAVRRQCEFHLKVAEPMHDAAFGSDDLSWQEYYDELSRAVAAHPNNVEARWLRSIAALHWFEVLRPPSPDPTFRELARAWDRDLQFLLTNFPEKPPAGASLAEAREMRKTYDRICRGIRI
ncbi:MAG: hypothetical protein VX498_00455 [Myxococcota bacterium]|nr:hypothetical protein [Myxococcota bacterium]